MQPRTGKGCPFPGKSGRYEVVAETPERPIGPEAVAGLSVRLDTRRDRMATELDRIESLVRQSIDGPDEQNVDALLDEAAQILLAHPDLDGAFVERYVTRHADEWELRRGLDLLNLLGRRRPYDHAPLLTLLGRADVYLGYKRTALFCITQLADTLGEPILLGLLDGLDGDLFRSAVHKTIDALRGVGDRGKAGRLLRRCLRATNTPDDEQQMSYLDTFVNRTEGNEDIFRAVLRKPLEPHEVVLLAVSLMRETLPRASPLRAEAAAGRSKLAEDYFNLYVGVYIAE